MATELSRVLAGDVKRSAAEKRRFEGRVLSTTSLFVYGAGDVLVRSGYKRFGFAIKCASLVAATTGVIHTLTGLE